MNTGMSRKITMYGLLVAMGSAIYILESYVPFPVPIPGARWGFSNMVILYALPDSPFSWLFAVAMGKALIGGLLSGRFLGPTFIMGVIGSGIASLVMYLSYKFFKKAGFVFHSTLGAICNNLAQVVIGAQIVASWAILSYLPYMEILGVVSGIVNAVVAGILVTRVSKEVKR